MNYTIHFLSNTNKTIPITDSVYEYTVPVPTTVCPPSSGASMVRVSAANRLGSGCPSEPVSLGYCCSYSRKFQGVQFLWNGDLLTFCSSILRLVEMCNNAITCLHKHACFVGQGIIFTVQQSTMKTIKIGPLENFPLYYGIFKTLYGKTCL